MSNDLETGGPVSPHESVSAINYIPLNPHYLELLEEREKAIGALGQANMDEHGHGELPFGIKYNEEGKLEAAMVNGIREGYGILGQLLKERALTGPRYRTKMSDDYIVEAYERNSRVREVIDKAASAHEDLEAIDAELEQIKTDKFEAYKFGNAVHKFFGRLNIPCEVLEDFNLNETLERIRTASQKDEKLLQEMVTLMKNLTSFRGVPLSEEQKRDLKPDAEALNRVANEIFYALINSQQWEIDEIRKAQDKGPWKPPFY